MRLESFKHNDWTKIWEGNWCFLSCSDFGYQYTKAIRFGKRPFAPQTIMFVSRGHSEGWMTQTDRDILGNYLSKQVMDDQRVATRISNELIKQSADILRFIEANRKMRVSLELFEEFWHRVLVYYKPHINIKYVVDYLDPKLLKIHLPKLQKARLIAEPVFRQTEEFTANLAKQLSKKTKYNHELLLCLTKEEVKDYFLKNKLPSRQELNRRDKRSAFLHENGKGRIFVGSSVDKIDCLVHPKIEQNSVEGSIAYAGKTSGIARIVLDPFQVKVFKKGDILIAGSTRPEFLPFMEKASAFVTDAGGILSHAAIVAREMKKPCVIGALVATKVFQDGDLVEVDANKGIVKKI